MRGRSGSIGIFHKKSKTALKISAPVEAMASTATNFLHARKSSIASNFSESSASSACSSAKSTFNPLSLHPPLCLNTSPQAIAGIPEESFDLERYAEDEEREERFFNNPEPPCAGDYLLDTTEYSPVKGRNCFFTRNDCVDGGRPYIYNAEEQWPLKDWQTVAPGLSASSSTETSPASSEPCSPSRPDFLQHQRRNTDWMNDRDVFVKRGEWKRKGIVFSQEDKEEDIHFQHFELPEL